MSYRDRLYAQYSTAVQGVSAAPSPGDMDRWGEPYDAWLRGWLPDDRAAPIVDVACGYGRLLRYFARRGYTNVRGVDISPEQVAIARTIAPDVELGNVVTYLEQHRGEFALVTAMDIVEHFSKDEVLAFLDACHGALRPGGAVIIQTPNADSPWSSTTRYGDFTHEICLNAQVLKTLLGVCGFRDFEAREQGPVPRGPASLVRAALWRLVRAGAILRTVIETGGPGSGILTRVFVARGVRG